MYFGLVSNNNIRFFYFSQSSSAHLSAPSPAALGIFSYSVHLVLILDIALFVILPRIVRNRVSSRSSRSNQVVPVIHVVHVIHVFYVLLGVLLVQLHGDVVVLLFPVCVRLYYHLYIFVDICVVFIS